MASPKLVLLTYPDNPRVGKALVAARYAGVTLETPDFAFGEDNKHEDYIRNAHPLGKVPVLQTPDGYIFESNAIARHIARLGDAREGGSAGLYGRTAFEASQVDMWVDYSNNEIDPAAITWFGPLLGVIPHNPKSTELAVANIEKALGALDLWLETRTFLVSERLTLADICVATSVLPLYQLVCDPEFRAPFVNVNRWFDTCINQPYFQEELQPGPLCGEDGPGVDPQAPAEEGKQKQKEGKKGKGPTSPKEQKKPKGEQKQEGKQKQKEGKKGKGPASPKQGKPTSPKQEPAKPAGPDEKKIKAVKKEGGKKGQDLAGMAEMGSLFQQAVLMEPGGDMPLMEMALEAMNKPVDPDGEERRGGAGGVAKILISANDDNLSVIVHVPEMFTKADAVGNDRGYEISAGDWLDASLATLPGDGKGAEISVKTPTMAKCTYKNDPENGRFVLKAKDAVSGASFSFLRSKSLVIEDDSDEMIFGDDDMPGY